MAHTLSIYDGVEATTLALANTTATGYHLLAYNPIAPNYLDQRNSSLYTPGEYSVIGKYSNIIETITVDIVGTSRDDLFVKLRALYRMIENARSWVQTPNRINPSYLSYKPDSTTNPAYCILLGGRVDPPGTDATILQGAGGEGEQLSNTMTGIVITIERESFWRDNVPSYNDSFLTTINSTTYDNPWAKLTLSSVAGDVPSPTLLSVTNLFSSNLNIFWAGYSSQTKKGTGYNSAGVVEAEANPYGDAFGTDTSAIADATASPGGGGNNKVQCTFATATDTERLKSYVTPGFGTFRVFLRCKLTAAGTVTMYLKSSSMAVGATKLSYAPVTITHTAWRIVDMGLVSIPNAPQLIRETTNPEYVLYVSALRSAGACSLDIDFLFLLPIDEGIVQFSGITLPLNFLAMYSNILPGMNMLYISDGIYQPSLFPKWSGYIRLQPGLGCIYVIGGDANFENTLAIGSNNYLIKVKNQSAYLTARGNG